MESKILVDRDLKLKLPCKNNRKAFLQKVVLTRMDSFNSAPKIINADSQDDGLIFPKNLNNDELLQYVKNLRSADLPQLLSRSFIIPIIDEKLFLNDINAGFECLKINSVPGSLASNIRLLQWNILSQTLAQHNDNFVCCPEAALTWENRKFLIVQEILQNNPDIICLQEVDHFKFLENILKTQNYKGIFFPKPDSPCLYIEDNNGPDGCAIFFKSEKFELKKFETHILEVWRVQSNQVAIAIQLELKSTGKKLCVCTTHLKARHSSLLSKLRNEQGIDLLRFLKIFAEDSAIILCGDFNAEPTEPVYKTILNCKTLRFSSAYANIREKSDKCRNKNVKNIININEIQKSIQSEPPYTTWKIREEGEVCHTIDYIFYSKEQLEVKNCLDFPQDYEIGKNRTPSFHYPSDHFSLVCDFEFQNNYQNNQKEKTN